MTQEHEQGIKALEHCLKSLLSCGRSISEMNFELAGITQEDLELFRCGEKFMTEAQFEGFHCILRSPLYFKKPLINWLNMGDHWALVGILEPTFSLNGQKIRAIMDFPYVIINNPDIKFKIGDTLTHTFPNGLQEEVYISNFEYSSFPKGYKPTYTLTVTRLKPNMQNNNINIGNMSGNARINSGNVHVTDNSSNEIHEIPADFFEQTRALLTEVNERHRQEFADMLAKIETAYASSNKKECGNWFGKIFSLAFTADCITVLQALLPLTSWLLKN